MATMTDIQSKAAEAATWFESATRGDIGREEDRYIRTKDGTPDWVRDLVQSAHGDFFPDDWRYEKISDALDFIAEADDPEDAAGEFADQAVDVYTSDRLAWLSSNLNRAGYCDEAAAEFGGGDTASDIIEMIGWGQYAEASEIYGLVLNALQS